VPCLFGDVKPIALRHLLVDPGSFSDAQEACEPCLVQLDAQVVNSRVCMRSDQHRSGSQRAAAAAAAGTTRRTVRLLCGTRKSKYDLDNRGRLACARKALN
jgi:hypothetical protein